MVIALSSFSLLGQIPAKVYSVDEVLSNYVYVFYAAFIVSFLFTPIVRSIALYYGIVDRPDRLRKVHSIPIAYLGGGSVFLGSLCWTAITQCLTFPSMNPGCPSPPPLARFHLLLH